MFFILDTETDMHILHRSFLVVAPQNSFYQLLVTLLQLFSEKTVIITTVQSIFPYSAQIIPRRDFFYSLF